MKTKSISFLVIVVLIGTYLIIDLTYVKSEKISADHLIFENYKEAIEASDAVVEVTASADSKNVLNKRPEYTTGYTETTVKINRVFENKNDNVGAELLENTNITVLEPTYTISNGIMPGATQFNYEGYTKLVDKATYVLFLKWDKIRESYWIHALEQGKFNVDDKDKFEKALVNESSQYEILKQDVLETLYP